MRLAAPPLVCGRWPGWGSAASAALHAAVAALIVLALWRREPEYETPPPPAFELEFAEGKPEAPGDPQAPIAAPPQIDVRPPVPEAVEAPPSLGALPLPPTPPLPAPVRPPIVVDLAPVPEPPARPPTPPQVTEAPPPPEPQDLAALPSPPPAAPPAPVRRQPILPPAALPQVVTNRALPGLYLPDGAPLTSRNTPRSSSSAVMRPTSIPRFAPEQNEGLPDYDVDLQGAVATDEWLHQFRIWLREHWRMSPEGIMLSHSGGNQIDVMLETNGRIRSSKLIQKSGQNYLDHSTRMLFGGGYVPAFPPGADPNGVKLMFRARYILR